MSTRVSRQERDVAALKPALRRRAPRVVLKFLVGFNELWFGILPFHDGKFYVFAGSARHILPYVVARSATLFYYVACRC